LGEKDSPLEPLPWFWPSSSNLGLQMSRTVCKYALVS
jgi:hypothetical protein